MRKKYILYIVVVSIFAVILCIDSVNTNKNTEPVKDNIDSKIVKNTENKEDSLPEIKNNAESYVVKFHNGFLNVYDSNDTIVYTLAVNFKAMREYDKKQFEKGVTIGSIEEIFHLAEDFSED